MQTMENHSFHGSRSHHSYFRDSPGAFRHRARMRCCAAILGSTCVNNHYASHRKMIRKRARHRDMMIFLAMTSTAKDTKDLRASPVICQFDTEAFTIGLDTCSSRCVSNNRRHFIELKRAPSTFGKPGGISGNATIEGV